MRTMMNETGEAESQRPTPIRAGREPLEAEPRMLTGDYRGINRASWDYLARHGTERPCVSEDFAYARSLLDPEGWIPWNELRSVLCLAGGGGQQGPLLAFLGLKVTVFDLSPQQLSLDRATARRHGVSLECVEGDMCCLERLQGRQFDLVYQPVSSCYVPDVRAMYRGVFQLLTPGGYYRVEHRNPIQLQLPQYGAWDGTGYRIIHTQAPNRPVRWREWDEKGKEKPTSQQYIHPLQTSIGDLCDVGFTIDCFQERQLQDPSADPGSPPHLAAYVPPSFTILSRRLPVGGVDNAEN